MNFTNVTKSPVSTPSPTTQPSCTNGYSIAVQEMGVILTIVLFGFFWTAIKVIKDRDKVVESLNSFLFLVGIPLLVFQGLAIQNIYSLPWSYIGVFFCLRVALFVLIAFMEPIRCSWRLKVYVADYMNSTWINTIIFGLPIYVALFGPKFAIFPILASISSFFFQLPIQLILFEIDEFRHPLESADTEAKSLEEGWTKTSSAINPTKLQLAVKLFKVFLKAVVNPILIAVVAGIFFSLTKWTLPYYLVQLCNYCG